MANAISIPEGFVIEQPTQTPGLPEGFEIVQQPQQTQQEVVAPIQELSGPQPITTTARELQERVLGLNRINGEDQLDSDILRGIAEFGATLVTGAGSEVLAGLSAIRALAQGGVDKTPQLVEQVRELGTFKPKTLSGRKLTEGTAKLLEPVANVMKEAETKLGDAAFKFTGSPAIAAAATTIPTAVLEATGLAGFKGLSSLNKRVKASRLRGDIASEIDKAVPTISQLKNTSRAIFSEIDNLGATIKPSPYNKLVSRVKTALVQRGVDPQITPKASRLLDRFEDNLGRVVPTSELEKLRTLAINVSKSADNVESALGSATVDIMDKFLDEFDLDVLDTPNTAVKANVGKRYKVARELWGRARRSELIEEAFEKARNAKAGFESGIQTQFRTILNNKKKRRYFRKDELKEMTKVVRGNRVTNLAQLLGKFDVIGKSPGALGILGFGGAVASAGVEGLAVPFVGFVSRNLASRLIKNQAEFANRVIRAGKDANKITEAYLKFTPKAQRNSAELSELLMRKDIDLDKLRKTVFNQEVIDAVRSKRANVDFENLGV